MNAFCVLSTKEEETYTSENVNVLDKLSNSFEAEAGFNLSTTGMMDYICPDWIDTNNKGEAKGSLGGSISWKWTLTSKGKFASDLQKLYKNSPDGLDDIFPVLNNKVKYFVSAPSTFIKMFKGNYFENALQKATSKMSGNYKVNEAFKIEQQETDKIEFNMSIPLAKWSVLGVGINAALDCGLAVDVSYYPTENYYSISDKRFFPVVLRSNKTLSTLTKELTTYLKNKFNSIFNDKDKEEICGHAGSIFDLDESELEEQFKELTNKNKPHFPGGGGGRAWVKRRAPQLVGIQQNDICTMSFSVNENTKNFDKGTKISSLHFYPMGRLLGVTDKNDTLFVVSEVFELSAIKGTDTLSTTKKGKMKLETTIGADDLTPFGLPENTPLDVYQADEGSEIWHYVGSAGKVLEVNRLGKYMMATSIKNDIIAPEIIADLDEKTGLLHIKVNENIGLRVNTLEVLVNGELREINMINESNFELQLNPEDLDYMLVIDINVYDLAGNKGNLVLIYNIDKPEMDDIEEHQMDSNATINLARRTLTVDGATPGAFVTVYSIDGVIQKKAATDADGHATIDLNSVLEGVYIVTLSDGKAKKFYVK